jgi:hypothetical protein
MASYSLDIGKYYPIDTSVLLHRHFDVGPKARDQPINANFYPNYLAHRVAFGHIHLRTKRPDGDFTPNSNTVVPTYTHTHIPPPVHVHTYARFDAHGHTSPDSYVDPRTGGDIDFHTYAYKHA